MKQKFANTVFTAEINHFFLATELVDMITLSMCTLVMSNINGWTIDTFYKSQSVIIPSVYFTFDYPVQIHFT